MSVQRMLDRTPLCPLCPHRPPLSGPRGDRPPRQRGGGRGQWQGDRVRTSRAAIVRAPCLSSLPCKTPVFRRRMCGGLEDRKLRSVRCLTAPPLSLALPVVASRQLVSLLRRIPGDPSLQHSGSCREQMLWAPPLHPGSLISPSLGHCLASGLVGSGQKCQRGWMSRGDP